MYNYIFCLCISQQPFVRTLHLRTKNLGPPNTSFLFCSVFGKYFSVSFTLIHTAWKIFGFSFTMHKILHIFEGILRDLQTFGTYTYSSRLIWPIHQMHLTFSLIFCFQKWKSDERPSIASWRIFSVKQNSQSQCSQSLVQVGFSSCSMIDFRDHRIAYSVVWLKPILFSLKCSVQHFSSGT